MGKRELVALLNLSSWCLVMVERLFLAVLRGCLRFVIVVFPDHTHLLFFITKIHNLKGIPQNVFLVALDVKSIYSNIPHSDGIKACDRFMSEGGKSQETRSVISKLINLVLT